MTRTYYTLIHNVLSFLTEITTSSNINKNLYHDHNIKKIVISIACFVICKVYDHMDELGCRK